MYVQPSAVFECAQTITMDPTGTQRIKKRRFHGNEMVIAMHTHDTMRNGAGGTKEIFTGIEDIQGMRNHHQMITMDLTAAEETIGIFQLTTTGDSTKGTAVGKKGGGMMKEIGIALEIEIGIAL